MSNNKQSMKLYTEEQVMATWNAAFMEGMSIDSEIYEPVFFENHLNTLTPIELPSDEEIKENLYHYSNEYMLGFKDAIWFIKNKIQGGNNEQ